MAKGNKELLAKINYSMDIIKRIEAGESFSQVEKQRILDDYSGMSADNNSYFTPFEICNFIKQLLDIKQGKIADLSGGTGSMIRPLVKEYGKLEDGIEFDCYEIDSNNSAAGKMAWSDYRQVNYYGNFNSIARCDEITDDYYDFVIGNPPFAGTVEYKAEWNVNNKGKINSKNDICNTFIDLAIRKVKVGGMIALVLPSSHMYKSNATAKLREWMKSQVALRAVIPLDADTFAESGVQGTSIGTILCIWQKEKTQGKVFVAELTNKKDVVAEMEALAYQFRLLMSKEYDIEYTSDCYRGTYGKLKQRVMQWGESL